MDATEQRSITIKPLITSFAWGSAYKTHVNKLQVKQNHFARVVFFMYLIYGENTPSALPLLNLLAFLTINNVYQFKALKFIHD